MIVVLPVPEFESPVTARLLTAEGCSCFRRDALIQHRDVHEPSCRLPGVCRPAEQRCHRRSNVHRGAGHTVEAGELRRVMSRQLRGPGIDARPHPLEERTDPPFAHFVDGVREDGSDAEVSAHRMLRVFDPTCRAHRRRLRERVAISHPTVSSAAESVRVSAVVGASPLAAELQLAG